MKREQFLITSTVGHNVIKSTWNSANTHIVKLVRVLAKEADCMFHMIDREAIKDDSGQYHVKGSQTWQNQKNSARVVFSVVKLVD